MIYTSAQNRAIDSHAINVMNIPSLDLMQRAAMKVYKVIEMNFNKPAHAVILCGNGNNGGDGFALACIMREKGYAVSVICCINKPLSPDSEYYKNKLNGVSLYNYYEDKSIAALIISNADIVLDAIYGNGFHGALNEDCCDICDILQASKCKVVSLDIPSGCICDTGYIESSAVKADITVAISTDKPCYHLYPSCEYCGKVVIADIGIPRDSFDSIECKFRDIELDLCKKKYKPRSDYSHKGTFGKLLAICGSENMPGAAGLVTLSALRSGVGIVKLVSVENVCNIVSAKYSEPVFAGFESKAELLQNIDTLLNDCSAVVVGCGLGRDEISIKIVEAILKKSTVPVLIDADGIISLKENIDALKCAACPVIITPHPKELSYLINMPVSEILKDVVGTAAETAKALDCVVLLKGAHTVIAAPSGAKYINSAANSGLAKGGSGDILSGLIGSLLAQGYSCEDAAVLGTYIHSKTAEICRDDMCVECMIPSDLPKFYSDVFRMFRK